MPIQIVGSYPTLQRMRTGSYSLDRACGNVYTNEWGMPLRSLYELYGPPESGKTTLGQHIGAMINPKSTILMAALEQVDQNYMIGVMAAAGFEGKVEFPEFQTDKGKWLGHAQMLTNVVNRLGRDEDVSCLILDSVAAIVPPAREDGVIGEGFMADRAKFMKDLTSRVEAKLMNRATPAVFIAINHVTDSLDPRNRGSVTPGGTGMKFHGAIRINLWRKEIFPKVDNTKEETRLMRGFISEGTVEKNRFGGRGRKFRLYLVPGRGLHMGMGAMFDCINLKLAERTETGTIKIDKVSAGRIGAFVTAAYERHEEKFAPFFELLDGYHPDLAEVDDGGEG